MPIAGELARKTYQERLFDSGLPDTEDFGKDALALAARDAVRAFLLFHRGEKPVAYLTRRLRMDSWSTITWGTTLNTQHVRVGLPVSVKCFRGAAISALLLGLLVFQQRTKKVFSTGEVLGADVFYFRPTLRNYVAVRLHYALDTFAERIGKLLDGLSLKRAIRRWLKRT